MLKRPDGPANKPAALRQAGRTRAVGHRAGEHGADPRAARHADRLPTRRLHARLPGGFNGCPPRTRTIPVATVTCDDCALGRSSLTDLRFAVPRCWSRGDSNRRSSLAFCPFGKEAKSGRFRPEFGGRSLGEQFSDRLRHSAPAETSSLSQALRTTKRTGGSNPLRSTNEELRTIRSICSNDDQV